jgi:hypothetical protein
MGERVREGDQPAVRRTGGVFPRAGARPRRVGARVDPTKLRLSSAWRARRCLGASEAAGEGDGLGVEEEETAEADGSRECLCLRPHASPEKGTNFPGAAYSRASREVRVARSGAVGWMEGMAAARRGRRGRSSDGVRYMAAV